MSENILFAELIKYYQQLKALYATTDWVQETKDNTERFYKEKIEELRIKCHEAKAKRLKELDTNRANDCTVTEAEEIS